MRSIRSACRIILFSAILGTCSVSFAAPGLNETEMKNLLKEGGDLFRQANETVGKTPDAAKGLYRQAVMRFERLAGEGGIHNGKLYYNIGNAYFRMEDLGRAILNYRRAAVYTPDDPNLRQNLEFARSKCQDKIEIRQKTKILNTLFFWHYDLSLRTRSELFAVFFVAIWTFALLRIFLKRPWTGWMLGISVFLAALFLFSVAEESWMIHGSKSGVVVSKDVVARKGDSETYEPSFIESLHAGTEFDVVEQRPDWYRVELADGRSCWIPVKSVELVR